MLEKRNKIVDGVERSLLKSGTRVESCWNCKELSG